MPVNPSIDPDMPGGVPLHPGAPDEPVDPKDPLPSGDPAGFKPPTKLPTRAPSSDTTES